MGGPHGRGWQVAEIRGVERASLRHRPGPPGHVETDATRTFGGEEDGWRHEVDGSVIGVCQRVPYEHVVVYLNDVSDAALATARRLLAPLQLPSCERPYPDAE